VSGAPLLTGAALERLFAPLESAGGVLAAVSGGPDSMALMGLLAAWAQVSGRPRLTVATIDHGLRAASAEEAALVAEAASGFGLPHRTLVWTGPKPATGLQETARKARYRLLADHSHEIGATHLVTAHTLDDQAETILMRMARGSGLAGLSGMRAVTVRSGLCHVRPLLGWPKADLVETCRTEGWPFIEDPSNADDRFARARWRKLLPLLAEEGLTPQRLARLAERVLRSEEALEAKAREAFARASVTGPEPSADAGTGWRLHGPVLLGEPFEITVRALRIAVERYRGDSEFLRLERLEACTERLRAALSKGGSLRLTVAGAVLSLARDGDFRVGPEPTRRRGHSLRVHGDAAASPHSLGKGGGHA